MSNPYDVERSWPPYFLEAREYADEKQGTYRAGSHPVWTVHVPDGWIGNSTFIEGDEWCHRLRHECVLRGRRAHHGRNSKGD